MPLRYVNERSRDLRGTELKRIIYIFTFLCGRFIKTVLLPSSYERLIIPGWRTGAGIFERTRTEIPQGVFGGPVPLPIHGPLRQAAFPISCALIEHPVLQGFERMRLVNHLGNSPKSLKIRAIRSYSINADISNKEHAHFAFGLGLGSKQPCQHINILLPGLYDCHCLTSLDF